MMQKTAESLAYVKFLRLVQEVQTHHDLTMLSPMEEKLLNLLALAWAQDKKITVMQAMDFVAEISQSTSHRLLKMLRLKNFIALQVDEVDNRIKYVEPAEKANLYFKALGTCIGHARLDAPFADATASSESESR